jgi:hypothetical protein
MLLASFTASGDGDAVIINFEAGQPSSIEIEGTTFPNPDPTIELTLTNENAHGMFFKGSVELRGNVDFHVDYGRGATDVNSGVATISGATHITTDGGNDVIDIQGRLGAFSKYQFDTGGGDDVVNLNTRFTAMEINLGDGDDRLTVPSNNLPISNGGEGFDEVEVLLDEPFDGFVFYHGIMDFEKVSMPDFFTGVDEKPIHRLELVENATAVSTNESTVVTFANGKSTEFINFNAFDSRAKSIDYEVRESKYPLFFRNANTVLIGGEFENGDTSLVLDQVVVESANKVIISDSSDGGAHTVFVSTASARESNLVLGLTPKAIFVANTNRTVLAGGDGLDRFFVSQFDSQLVLHGNGGADRFFIGHNQQAVTKDLAKVGSFINIVAGDGNDFLRADDSGSKEDRRFRLRNNWIHSSGDSPDKKFGGIFFTGVERSELLANDLSTRFYFSPSQETQFTIRGGSKEISFDALNRLDSAFESLSYLFSPSQGRFVYLFGELGYRFIQVYI